MGLCDSTDAIFDMGGPCLIRCVIVQHCGSSGDKILTELRGVSDGFQSLSERSSTELGLKLNVKA